MSKRTSADQDQYIQNVALQVMGALKITPEVFSQICGTAHTFSRGICDEVYNWVDCRITNTGTLAKIIECGVSQDDVVVHRRECRSRFTPWKHVVVNGRFVDDTGIGALRTMATWVICAAIYDIFLERDYNAEFERSERIHGPHAEYPATRF